MSNEADIHAELYRHVQNRIDQEVELNGLNYTDATNEMSVPGGGWADLVIEVDHDPFLVVEAKREPTSGIARDINPYSPKVIKQASEYAFKLGAPYFATYNGTQLVLFETWERKPFLDRKSRAYRIENVSNFAQDLLEEVAAIERDEIEWDPHDEAFLARLETFRFRLQEEFQKSLESRLEDAEFESEFRQWVGEQGWEERYKNHSQEVHHDFTSQSSYLLMNKLVFYKTLEDADAYDPPQISLEELSDPETRRLVFDELMERIDFEAIYEQDPIFDSLPLSEKARREVRELLSELEEYNLTQIDEDIVGGIYEKIIPEDERQALGQYYTPKEVTELITDFVVRSPDDEVLDPACGSGGFLLAIYDRLKAVRASTNLPVNHQSILNQIHGIDINRFPAHLSAINLALKDLDSKTTDTNIIVEDFFNIRPSDGRLAELEAATTGGEDQTFQVPSSVDAIVGNPPYIEASEIADDVDSRRHLRRQDLNLDNNSDIYTYFFTHGTEFLKDGGRLGYITSNKWLAVRYGVKLKEFLLENYRIEAIIKPQRRVFEGQLVPTCITVLEKCKNPTERDNSITKFLLINEQLDPEEIIRVIETDYEADMLYSREGYRLATKRQGDLDPERKWTQYLFAPPEFWSLYGHEKMTRLGADEMADIGRGDTTGNNSYFYLDAQDLEEWDIEQQFLTKTVKSITEFDGIEHDPKESPNFLFDCQTFTEEYLASSRAPSTSLRKEVQRVEREYHRSLADGEKISRSLTEEEITVIAGIKDEGYDNAFEYLRWGIRQGVHTGSQCAGRRFWFVVGEQRPTRLVSPKNIRGRPFFPILSESAPVGNTLYRVQLNDETDLDVVAGFLNSNVGKLFFELQGTSVRGGLVELRSYELKDFHVLDPAQLEEVERERIETAFQAIKNVDVHEDETPEKMLELDRAVLAPFGLEDRAEKIADVATSLSQSRQLEQEFEIPVTEEQTTAQDLSGSKRIDGQVKLDSF